MKENFKAALALAQKKVWSSRKFEFQFYNRLAVQTFFLHYTLLFSLKSISLKFYTDLKFHLVPNLCIFDDFLHLW